MFLGYIFAFLSSLFLSLYIVPKKFNKQNSLFYTFLIGIGYFVISLVSFLVCKIFFNINEPVNLYVLFSVLDGICWVVASISFIKTIDILGLTKAGVFKNLQGPISAVLFLFVLSEYKNVNVLFILLAFIFIFLSQICFNVNTNLKVLNKAQKTQGTFFGIFSALMFALNAVLRKLSSLHGIVYSAQIYSSLTILLLSFVILLFKKEFSFKKLKQKNNLCGILSGSLYFFASLFMTLSYFYISGSITSTITKLSSLWTVLVGIIFFKEIDFKKYWFKISLGIIFILFAILMLFIS